MKRHRETILTHCSHCDTHTECHRYRGKSEWLCERCLGDDLEYFDPYPHASWEAWYEDLFVEMCRRVLRNLTEDWGYEASEAVPIAGQICLEAMPSRATCVAALRSRRVPQSDIVGLFENTYETLVDEAEHWLGKYG